MVEIIMRKYFIGGNWKCNGTIESVKNIIAILNNSPNNISSPSTEVVIAVPNIYISMVQNLLKKNISICAQNIGLNGNGAYTGETSAEMLVDFGVKWTLIGHSERRIGFDESYEIVAKKTREALDKDMSVILCIGESLEDCQDGLSLKICINQLKSVFNILKNNDFDKIVIVYEPIWSIGTGKVASAIQVEEIHAKIISWIAENISLEISQKIRIIYGGSVKANNCHELIECHNIDGFLVGGASLLPEFIDICTL